MILGIDTSNYTSSVSLVDHGEIIEDRRILLKTKKGERGLRQSDALFQHWQNIPLLIKPVLEEYGNDINGIAVSTRPRPQDGSYMPVFNAGNAVAQIVGASLHVPVMELSHQEGHIYSAAHKNSVDFSKPVICAHLSGGTLEIVRLYEGKVSIVAETLDISYGQLLDRTGVALGHDFPAGAQIDKLAVSFSSKAEKNWKNPFCKINVTEIGVNLSGLETQIMAKLHDFSQEELSYAILRRVAESFSAIIHGALKKEADAQVLISGGVASSTFLRSALQGENWMFGEPRLCSDNAVGIALYTERKFS